jgi:hypothetical protein
MPNTALELIAPELQGVALSEADIARAVSLAGPTNQNVKEAADTRLRFDDEPAGYLAFLEAEADKP